jgi:hypothetical protein
MAEGTLPIQATADGPATARGMSDPAKQALERVLATKVAQGFVVESQSDGQAVLVTAGRKRLFGLRGNLAGVREVVSVDDAGAVTIRKMDGDSR